MLPNNPDYPTKKLKEISIKKLTEILKKVQPMLELKKKSGIKFYATNCNPKNESFNWVENPPEITDVDLKPFKEVITRHSWAYYGFFKPTAEEVISQLSKKDLEECDAFSTSECVGFTADGNQHLGLTKLYKRNNKNLQTLIL